ncbi:MAG: hypothetical protein D6744_06580 [Planctomycetota bacterium]|nr:MAG: hypothetical protein D6744_06580 [Planctomycetota bacterium]
MSTIHATTLGEHTPAQTIERRDEHGRVPPRWKLRFRWLIRPRRVLLVLAALWVLNIFDLGFTLLEATRANFIELNPLVGEHVRTNPAFVVAYKITLVAVGSTILLVLRRQRVAELGCWFLFAIYALLLMHWSGYYAYLHDTLSDPATNVSPLTGMITPF